MNWKNLTDLHDEMAKHNPYYHEVIQTITKLHLKKSHDYAKTDNRYSNFEYSGMVAEPFTNPTDRSFAVLIGTKMARIAELRSGKEPNNESLRDSFIDLANYACIWASYYLQEIAPNILDESNRLHMLCSKCRFCDKHCREKGGGCNGLPGWFHEPCSECLRQKIRPQTAGFVIDVQNSDPDTYTKR